MGTVASHDGDAAEDNQTDEERTPLTMQDEDPVVDPEGIGGGIMDYGEYSDWMNQEAAKSTDFF
jgi:hypothetical protein